MSAANTDKLKKLSPRWVGAIGSAGVADGIVETIPLSSTAGLPTDTAVVVTINRVDVSGNKTTGGVDETVIGVVSGDNLINCIRGVEGNAQAHAAGQVVEVLVTARGWNDLVDAFLTAFNQDGTIKADTILTTPKINDTSSDHQYVLGVNELTANRVVTLPLLTASDEFVFKNHTATLGNKTLTTPVIASFYQDAEKTKLMTTPDTASDTLVAKAATQTLTNKRVTRRCPTVTQAAEPAINTDVTDVAHITGLAQNITSMTTNLTGTPVEGDTLRIDITDNGTPRSITWGAKFESSSSVSLPTTTVANVRLDVGFFWNSATSKWRCVAVS